jgi:mRNA interferase RelE/StbE
MPYLVKIRRQARQKLKLLSRPDRLRLTDAISELANNPDHNSLDVKPLENSNLYRLRVGKWRVLFERFDEIRILSVEKIGPRGDIYK